MNLSICALFCLAAITVQPNLSFGQEAETQLSLSYPIAPKGDVVDNYGGINVADPFRWMEDVDSPAVKQWVESENSLTFDYLSRIPTRASIKSKFEKIINYERFGVPFKQGGQYFYTRNSGLQNQSALYTVSSISGKPRLLLDPNTLSADGTVALSSYSVSDDGKYLAYGLSSSGSDWTEWHVRDTATGKDLKDDLKWVKFSGAYWDHDSQGFYYGRFATPNSESLLRDANFNQQLYYHRVGTPQSDDVLVYSRPDHKEWMFGAQVTDDGRYLLISVSRDTSPNNALMYKDLSQPDSEVKPWLTKFDASYNYLGNDGARFYFQSNLNAPQSQVIALHINDSQDQTPEVIIPESRDTITSVSLFGNKFVVEALHDAHTVVREYAIDGKLMGELKLPGIGTADGFSGKRKDNETFYSYSSFTFPTTIYHFNITNSTSTLFRRPVVDFDSSPYTTTQAFYWSKDGTRVPIFIVSKKGLVLDGSHPTILYGYGGFDISITPYFSSTIAVWLELGGVYAIANIRGGGEYGESWHLAGTKEHKQNVFDDFIGAAQYLIAEKYTSTPKLAINGGSNGGLLIGACLTQRPDLFGAAIPEVGVLDMLRFNKFTVGWAWESDYGDPDDPNDFKYLYKYSPLQNVRAGTSYPPTLILTADHDDRVFPAHSFKFAATLQADQSGSAPILIRIDSKAGHGAGKPLDKIIDQEADELAFLTKELAM